MTQALQKLSPEWAEQIRAEYLRLKQDETHVHNNLMHERILNQWEQNSPAMWERLRKMRLTTPLAYFLSRTDLRRAETVLHQAEADKGTLTTAVAQDINALRLLTLPDAVQRKLITPAKAIDADLVVLGLGAAPELEWLGGSGLVVENGVMCDETLWAGPGVVAAGDVANWFNPTFGERMRVEHWENAIEQGEAAARRLLAARDGAEPAAFRSVPWFWSDQYDCKMQLAGRPGPDDEIVLIDKLEFAAPKTKEMASILKTLGCEGKSVLVAGLCRLFANRGLRVRPSVRVERTLRTDAARRVGSLECDKRSDDSQRGSGDADVVFGDGWR